MTFDGLTVRQLIEHLQQFPDDLPVVVHSYEAGFDPVTQVNTLMVEPSPDRQWYAGVYEPTSGPGQNALLISSKYYRAETK